MATVIETSGNGGGTIGSGPENKGVTTADFVLNPETSQSVAYTGTAGTITNPVNAELARLVATTDCFIATGASPTATTSDMYLPNGVVQVVKIPYGHKVSAIRLSVSGTLYVSEVS